MRKTEKQPAEAQAVDRRGFLRAVGGAGSLAAAAVVAPVTGAVAAETEDEKRRPRYQETDHVQAFYRTNRY